MDVGGMFGTHVRQLSIAEQDVIGAPAEEPPMIAVKIVKNGLLSSRSLERDGSPSRAASSGAASLRFPMAGHR
jgi:hypothetical protein